LREKNARLLPSKSDRVLESSFVFVDYSAFDGDGRALAGITAKNYVVDLNSQNIVREFKEVLKNAQIGDEKITKIEYKADYPNKVLAGKTVTFKIKVIEIKEKEFPELNDDFAKDLGAENLEDLKIKVKESMEAEEKRRQDMDIERQIIEYLLEKNEFEVPKSLIAEQKKSLIEKMKNYLENQDLSKEYIEEQIKFRHEKFKEEAEKNLRLSYILNAIYAKENLAVTDADIKVEKNKIKALNPGREDTIDKYFSEKREAITSSLKERKLFSFLIGSAKIETEEKNMPLMEKTETQRDNSTCGEKVKAESKC
jgi:trigger factor